MKLRYTFECVDMGEEIILVPVGEGSMLVHGVLKMNEEGKTIIDCLRTEVTVEQIVAYLAEKYDNDVHSLRTYVLNTIQVLKDAGLIEG